ncbi:hypothetical protein [Carnimonas bestiolae]|uniref:hypothetical protein n=1 Tax=Carnimonas bestiolae TaxID=3402172 RepID=UPI003EDC6E55
MATPQWPADLPRPVIDSYGWSHTQPTQFTTMQSGRQRGRRRFGRTPSEAQCSLRYLTRDQAVAFEGFIEYEANAGAAWFLAPMETPRTEGVEWMRVVLPNYYDGPNIDAVSGLYSFTFSAYVMAAPIPSEEQYAEAALLGGLTVEEALAEIQNINTHWVPYGPDSDYYVMPPSGRQVAGVGDG